MKIREDVMLLLQKNAGTFAEAFDIILTIWTHIKSYRDSLFLILEVIIIITLTSSRINRIISIIESTHQFPGFI